MSDTLSVVVVLGRRFSSRKVGDTELERNTSFPMEGAEGDVEKVKLEFDTRDLKYKYSQSNDRVCV